MTEQTRTLHESEELQQLWARRSSLLAPQLRFNLHQSQDIAADLFDLPPAQNEATPKSSGAPASSCMDVLSITQNHVVTHHEDDLLWTKQEILGRLVLDAATLGEVPARYHVTALRPHEMAVVGAYIDPRVAPGFCYRVRTLGEDSRTLFKGRAIKLLSIGRGYGRRLTFEADKGRLNENPNFFWSDSSPEGFALELEVVKTGNKFTVLDANHVVAGTLELLHTQGPQVEVPGRGAKGEKAVRVRALCRVEWFESGEEQVVPLRGVALCMASRAPRLAHVALGHMRGLSLEPGSSDHLRRTTLCGINIGDIPTAYTVIGLEAHEMPVVGTYVDPRLSTGFHYRVRRLGGGPGRWLFNGRGLCLLSIGAGYAKRLTFQPDRLNAPENFFWSDSGHGDGFACEIRAVFTGQKFSVEAGGAHLGEATVFRADSAQSEESSERLSNGALVKRVRIDVTCNVSLEAAATQTMRVSGTAILVREPGKSRATLQRIENVGLNSQLNLLFARESASVDFYPLPVKSVVY